MFLATMINSSIFRFLALLALISYLETSCASDHGSEVTFGSVIKLQHDHLKVRLHSHDVAYGSGSGQHSVTGFTGEDDSNDYWIVSCPNGVSCKQGEAIASNSIIRLQHMKTRRWLHSHLHHSPITQNLEVSGYGSDGQSDTGDHWKVELEGKSKFWSRDQKIRLFHLDTKAYLHSHDRKYGRPIGGQYEVCGVSRKGNDNLWLATEGVYFPVRS